MARQISRALAARSFPLIIGHGAGSFGHVLAHQFEATQGIHPKHGWEGFHQIRLSMMAMNRRIVDSFAQEQLQVVTIQPSAIMVADDGRLATMALDSIRQLLGFGQIPLIHGDVVLDQRRGFTILSTETQLLGLADQLQVKRIIMVSDVAGVLDAQGQLIDRIDSANYQRVLSCLKGSGGVDVTGGMRHKVLRLFELARRDPERSLLILSGYGDDAILERALLGESVQGTVICA